ncbi:hypothetical protein DBT_0129 [Dissulfuribacter thermophilus]|uniref:Purine nucleoside phosphorylase n=2 Tax=Dissulfuribacter thermophilus TaxID=1156395 RepID=A0A1B9F8S7_9BACT|nr:hypothetical protein DBT_0129 [Dissulfuribacter thermophilus]
MLLINVIKIRIFKTSHFSNISISMKKANTLSYVEIMPHLPPYFRDKLKALTYKRRGGVSLPPYDTLNLGLFVGDTPENLERNLRIICNHFGVDLERLVALKQVHSNKVLVISEVPDSLVVGEADGLVTDVKGLALMIHHADCQAIVFFDPRKQIIGNCHAGWRGLSNGIVENMVSTMVRFFDSRPKDLWVGISPALGPCCGEFKGWRELLPVWMRDFIFNGDHLDLKRATLSKLHEVGIHPNHIFSSNICTRCSKDFFSYRRDKKTGRLGTLGMLTP